MNVHGHSPEELEEAWRIYHSVKRWDDGSSLNCQLHTVGERKYTLEALENEFDLKPKLPLVKNPVYSPGGFVLVLGYSVAVTAPFWFLPEPHCFIYGGAMTLIMSAINFANRGMLKKYLINYDKKD